MRSLLIYSGGMDSTVLLYAKKEEIGLAVNFQYGSRHNQAEAKMAVENCSDLGIPFQIVDLSIPFQNLRSVLLDPVSKIPEGHYQDETMKQTVVPFRNGIFLSFAAGIAESRKLHSVMIANHSGDHAIYPDCGPAFITGMTGAIACGTWEKIALEAPFTCMTKREIAILGKTLKVPFDKTYSCYCGGEIHCGKCGTCVERKEALEGFDPTLYSVR